MPEHPEWFHPVGTIARVGLCTFLGLCAGIVAFKILSGRIQTSGLLDSKPAGSLDPSRVQMLVLSVMLAMTTLFRIGTMRDSGVISLPSNSLLYLMGSSHLIYLVSKFFQVRRR